MKRLLLIFAVVGLCMGQNCTAPVNQPYDPMQDPARLQVNDHLRAACTGWVQTEADIEAMLIAADSDISRGITFDEQVVAIVDYTCIGPSLEANVGCNRCMIAIVNQAYGR